MAGAYCRFCGHRCFVERALPDGRHLHMATCAKGAAHDLDKTGFDFNTARNPYAEGASIEGSRSRLTAACALNVEVVMVRRDDLYTALLDRQSMTRAFEHWRGLANRETVAHADALLRVDAAEAALRKVRDYLERCQELRVEPSTQGLTEALAGEETPDARP